MLFEKTNVSDTNVLTPTWMRISSREQCAKRRILFQTSHWVPPMTKFSTTKGTYIHCK